MQRNFQTQTNTSSQRAILLQIARIAFFVVLLTLAAKLRITIPGSPIPVTLQTLTVMAAGFTLGAREGALSILAYLGLIAVGVPLDSFGRGSAAFAGLTAGYLIGFVPMAYICGLSRITGRTVQSDTRRLFTMLFAGVISVLVLLACGTIWYSIYAGLPFSQAILVSAYPFLLLEPVKAILAAGIVLLGRESWLRYFDSAPNE